MLLFVKIVDANLRFIVLLLELYEYQTTYSYSFALIYQTIGQGCSTFVERGPLK